MTDRTFSVAGTSFHNGVIKYRFANDLESRVKHLERVGHTDVNMMWLPEPMTRDAAISWLNSQGITISSDARPSPARPAARNRIQIKAKPVQSDDLDSKWDDNGFVEPKDEKIQVAMCRLARTNPGLSAQELLTKVLQAQKQFGDSEPNF